RDSAGAMRAHLGGAVVPRGEHAARAKHFEALVVPISGAPAGVDLAEPPLSGPDRHGSGVGVARLRDGGIDQAAGRRIDRLRFVAEDPAADVEVVDELVLEDSAGPLDVRDRRRSWIAAGDGEDLDLADLAGVEAALQRREGGVVAALEA